jgi:predicted DNA-binding transcriptional regulator YafY
MPLNKNASFRYRVINECLRNTARRWTFEDLQKHISAKLFDEFDIAKGISPRQLAEDIHIMRKLPPTGYDAPIKRRAGYIYYEDPVFSIDQNPLSESDIEALEEALSLLKQFKDLPHYEDLRRIPFKIQGSVNLQTYKKSLIQFETNTLVKGTELIPILSDSISNKRPVNVIYKSFKADKEKSEILHPYILKEYRNRWFVIGYNEMQEGISNYALDRIVRIEITKTSWIDNTFFDSDHYFDNVIGVTVIEGNTPEKIQIKLNPVLAPYIITKPIHNTQKIIMECKAYTIIEVSLVSNYEFESLILSFGEYAEILTKGETRDHIRKQINGLLEIYKEY